MSEMLAVLLGAGGSGTSQALAALATGKSEAKNGHDPAADPFMEVLSSRLSALPGAAVQPASAALASGGAIVEVLQDAEADADGDAQTPVKFPEAEMLGTQWSPGDVLPQAVQAALLAPLVQAQHLAGFQSVPAPDLAGFALSADMAVGVEVQAALLAPLVQAQHLAGVPSEPAAVLVGTALSADTVVGKEVPGEGRAQSARLALVIQGKANSEAGAADTAEIGQLLPPGRETIDLNLRQPLKDILSAQPAPLPTSVGVAQTLAAQIQPTAAESLGGVSGPAGQAMFLGAAHGMSVMGDVQGRSMPGAANLAIDVPLRSPLFPQELGERIVWLSARQGQVADISLNPSHLGPLEVKLSLLGGEAGAQFFSPHPQVRDAIEAALPKLREMLADVGVTLGQTQVRQESFSRQGAMSPGDRPHEVLGSDEGSRGSPADGLLPRRAGLGLVDTYV